MQIAEYQAGGQRSDRRPVPFKGNIFMGAQHSIPIYLHLHTHTTTNMVYLLLPPLDGADTKEQRDQVTCPRAHSKWQSQHLKHQGSLSIHSALTHYTIVPLHQR